MKKGPGDQPGFSPKTGIKSFALNTLHRTKNFGHYFQYFGEKAQWKYQPKLIFLNTLHQFTGEGRSRNTTNEP
jgi:hypothetical protein